MREKEGTNWIDLARNTDRCQAFMNNVMNIRFP